MEKLDFLMPPVIKDVKDNIISVFTEDREFYDFYNKNLVKYRSCETHLYDFMSRLDQKIMAGGIDLSPEVMNSMKTMASLFDACTAIPYLSREESEIIGEGYPAFVVYHKEKNTNDFLLAFANAAYLKESRIGSLSDIRGLPEPSIMNKIYTSNNVYDFRKAARNMNGGYNAKFIEMDRMDNGQKKAYFWYLREFTHPDGSTIQIRIGMNVSSLSEEQRDELKEVYNATEEMNKQKIAKKHLSPVSYENITGEIQRKIDLILRSTNPNKTTMVPSLRWIKMLFEIANGIMNSSVPLVTIDDRNKVEQMNLSYSIIGGGLTCESSFERIMMKPGLARVRERFGEIIPVCHPIPAGGYIQFHRLLQPKQPTKIVY
ncbi:hypothetical protein GW819_02180 [Candidatus Gracilibacteria bacterium]|nr:hypothetical protein [Candidatus Gracilibacteria bacterium]OIO76637.1 MAG: hypothetical protein AUJ87_02360 [Candidatus Gracilibacteria bacterium CG1_02_38_174]PIQ11316.1 MAG: hypothetical protein COW68_02960 [Candidatus Gracilibacteria bacterium CG18_big_fil_WC_8_21_14_2_50_38_16]PIQ41130.1 MAG: hypothetical protein COW06_03940 [Candidatus Gracilibacteria bacterium CG12_big_fil_rev_8_21_14_0_65_38_15]PIZ02047.1 MAG: hypothetical protein COY60_00395 [Candidatus Gracilibacteria bacterium CG_4